jgi:hypothetical protein
MRPYRSAAFSLKTSFRKSISLETEQLTFSLAPYTEIQQRCEWCLKAVQQGVHAPHLKSAEVDAFVVTELPIGHVAVVLDDLAHVLGRHVLLLLVNKPKLALLRVPLGLQLLPLLGCKS